MNLLLLGGLLAGAAVWRDSLSAAPQNSVLLATAAVGLIGVLAWSGCYALWRGSTHRIVQEPWFEAFGLIVTGAIAAVFLLLAWQVDDPATSPGCPREIQGPWDNCILKNSTVRFHASFAAASS